MHTYVMFARSSMGYGVAASIGGQIASPDRQVVCICGDGGFQMQGMEVMTAVNYDVPVKWFILNNSSLAMIRDTQDVLFKGRRFNADFVNPDYVKLAESMGAVGLRVEKPDEIEGIVEQALDNGRPTLVDVLIDPEEAPSFDARAEAMTRARGLQAARAYWIIIPAWVLRFLKLVEWNLERKFKITWMTHMDF